MDSPEIVGPRGITTDAAGFVYVTVAEGVVMGETDAFHRILKLKDGVVVGSFGTYGTGAAGQFRFPYGPAVAASGYVYVSDNWNSRLQRIDQRPAVWVLPTANPVSTGEKVTLDGSRSLTPLSSAAKYEWDLDDDGAFELDTGRAPTASRSFDNAGAHTVALRLTDAEGRASTGSVTLDVRPAAPAGDVGVSINDGARFTNDPSVMIDVVWPKHALEVRLSNDGGFRHAKAFPVRPRISWKLDSTGPERLPKTLYARFRGGAANESQTFQDDIILDETPPLLSPPVSPDLAPAGVSGHRRYRLRLRARDKTSGVNKMQITSNKRRPGKLKRYRMHARFRTHGTKILVRVQDTAGNFSSWKRVRPARR